jgi:ABC-type phosphate/phosphonate transport system substrate-binding protein
MYPQPSVRGDWDALYAAAAQHVHGAPPALDWGADAHASWRDPELALGMSCGWPLVHDLGDAVRVVGTFAYRGSSTYRSVIVARPGATLDGLSDGRAAVNSWDSLSGYISLLAAFDLVGWPGPCTVTGSHAESIAAVRAGEADVASIDAITWAYGARDRPESLEGVEIVGEGPDVPCLPLIVPASAGEEAVGAWRSALAAAVATPELAPVLERLLITGFDPMDAGDYVAALAAVRPAAIAG